MSIPTIALLSVASIGCSSAAAPGPERPTPVAATVDAAIDVAPADAPDAASTAPPWLFRYHTKDRTETWTLRFAEGHALLVVDSAQSTLRYAGTATDGISLAIDVSTGTARLTLDCKRSKRPLGAACNERKAKQIDVLDCYHPDFKTPMPFALGPGVEYVSDERCTGYRLISP